MPGSTATRATIAHRRSERRATPASFHNPQQQCEDIALEAHGIVDRVGSEVITDLHVLSTVVFRAKTRGEVVTHIHRAIAAVSDRIAGGKSKLRALTRELAGIV